MKVRKMKKKKILKKNYGHLLKGFKLLINFDSILEKRGETIPG